MVIREHRDAAQFAQLVEPVLIERECENCLAIGLLRSSLPPRLMLSIESAGQIVGAALQTRPIALVVTPLPQAAIEPLSRYLKELNWPGTGFVGPAATVEPLAQRWGEVSGRARRLHRALRVFQLTQVVAPPSIPGRMIPAAEQHLDVLSRWRNEFSQFGGEPDENPGQSVQRLIDQQKLFVWEQNGELRSMTGVAGPTPNGIRTLNQVYTPPELRGRGFASNLVAAVSRQMLDSGRKFCFLFTDATNPTSNHIYQQIGYHPVSDFRHWIFE